MGRFELRSESLNNASGEVQSRIFIDNRLIQYASGNALILALGVALLSGIWFFPIVASHVSGADSYLIHSPAIMRYHATTAADAYHVIARRIVRQNPEFFSFGVMPLVFWLVLPASVIKFLQLALVVLSFVLYSLVVQRLCSSNPAALTAVIATIAAWQFRQPIDPVVGTSLLVPWAASLSLFAFYAWLRYTESKDWSWLGASLLFFIAAALCGIVPFFLMTFLALLAAVTHFSSLKRASLTLLALALAVVIALFESHTIALRSALAAQSGENILVQIVAAMPTSFRAFGHLPVGHVPSLYHGTRYIDDRFIKISNISAAGWLVTFALAVITFFTRFRVPARRGPVLYTIALAFWLIPALLTAPSQAWSHGLPFGQGSEMVYFEYFGVGFILTLIMGYGYAHLAVTTRLTAALACVAVFVLCYGNIRANTSVLARIARMDVPRQTLQRVAYAGFFDSVPEGTVIAVDPKLFFPDDAGIQVSDARYVLFHYSDRRYAVVSTQSLSRTVSRDVWALSMNPSGDLPLAVYHVVSVQGTKILTDHAKAFDTSDDPWKGIRTEMRGVRENVIKLNDGNLLDAVRSCGLVLSAKAFDESVPSITYESGFYHSGPYGYPYTVPVDEPYYPKMYMASTGTLIISPSRCPATAVNFTADVVAGGLGRVTIRSPFGTDHVDVSPNVAHFYLRFSGLNHPIKLFFSTNAPESDLDPVDYRYERDIPRHLRLIMEPTRVWEDLVPRRARR